MPYDAQDMIDTIRHAYSRARITRAPTFIIEQNGALRVTSHPSPYDQIVVEGITPPRWNAEIERAIIDAYGEFADAEPALRRAAHIIANSAKGPRDAPDIEEIAEGVMRRFCMSQDIGDDYHSRIRRNRRKPSFFTRMFGSGR